MQQLRGLGDSRVLRAIAPSLKGGLGWVFLFIFLFNVQCSMFNVFAQTPIIRGNVYGGGNKGDVKGNTKVKVTDGDIDRVFGGARMADVGGHTYMHIENKGDDPATTGTDEGTMILINQAYGGNDIAGTIGTSGEPEEIDQVPAELTAVKRDPSQYPDDAKDVKKNAINNSWNTFVHIGGNEGEITTTGTVGHETTHNALLIGSLYAGGNGEYDYDQKTNVPTSGKTTHYIYNKGEKNKVGAVPIATMVTDNGAVGFQTPELDKTYLEIVGGSIGQAFGGGNDATIRQNTTIYVENPTKVVNSIKRDGEEILIVPEREAKMGYNTGYTYMSSDAFQIGNFFGGNNRATMAIRPLWNLQGGKIRNLYSGGNKGAMTSPVGILLEINPKEDNTIPLIIDYVYGGCRMADVMPTSDGTLDKTKLVLAPNLNGYKFPIGLPARTLVRGGHVNNVYGGNDVAGRVYGGNAVGIYTDVYGDVYGGGNGAYPYTDQSVLIDDPTYGDLYYTATGSGLSSIQALNDYIPNAEQISLRLSGKEILDDQGNVTKTIPTIIHGRVFLGGNCATLQKNPETEALISSLGTEYQAQKDAYPLVELKMGSNVIAENVYLGNNGEELIATNEQEWDTDGNLKSRGGMLWMLKQNNAGLHITDKTFTKLCNIDLTQKNQFDEFMLGVAMPMKPKVVFDTRPNDPTDYRPYSSYIGSLYFGGNVGSMTYEGKHTIDNLDKLVIYNKLVGGCRNADVPERDGFNAAYSGGILGSADEQVETNGKTAYEGQDRLQMEFNGLQIRPMRLAKNPDGTYKENADGKHYLEWNTVKWGDVYFELETNTTLDEGKNYYTYDESTQTYTEHTVASGSSVTVGVNDHFFEKGEGYVEIATNEGTAEERRLANGNIYGGCYEGGHINGNIVININESLIDTTAVFARSKQMTGVDYEDWEIDSNYGDADYNSGVIKYKQAYDVMSIAMTTFGAGMGENTEIWGSTTVNLNKGYTFQIFGGGEEGVVGKKNSNGDYEFNPDFSTYVNLNGENAGHSPTSFGGEVAEAEYLYGGGNAGDVCGNTYVNLGNGRIYDAFGGASDADVLGHTEVHIGRQPDGTGYKSGFPWIKDIVYGGNDFGGKIRGTFEDGYDFTKRVRNYNDDTAQNIKGIKELIYGYTSSTDVPDVLKGHAYVEYTEGRVDSIFGGNFGMYNYNAELYKDELGNKPEPPFVRSTTISIRPNTNPDNVIKAVLGGSTGFPLYRKSDNMQDQSYVLIDIPDDIAPETNKFSAMEVFGGGSYGGVGMGLSTGTFDLDDGSAIIDLIHGSKGIGNVYGGSYNEGITRRTVINVPAVKDAQGNVIKSSTIKVGSIYGGAYGTKTLPPCDVYGSNVNYASGDACVTGSIYGGNNSERRTLYTHVNISAPVWSDKDKGWLATVYGAGRGENTWSEYTEVNLNKGAHVYQVYGGGEKGHVLNSQTVQKYMTEFYTAQGCESIDDPRWLDAWRIGDYFKLETSNDFYNYVNEPNVNLWSPYPELVKKAEVDDRDFSGFTTEEKNRRYRLFNTNVRINEGAVVEGYAYGGGLGVSSRPQSGDVWGDTYIALLGGVVKKNLYAAGSSGGVDDGFGLGAYDATIDSNTGKPKNPNGFTASANAYIGGGTARNVFGGGWEGHVGTEANPGETHVVVGKTNGTTFFDGIPAVERNAYAGGEGGSVYGTGNVTVNNGYIGYRYLGADSPYYYGTEDTSIEGDKPTVDVLKPANTPLEQCFVEKLDDETNIKTDQLTGKRTWIGKKSLIECGSVYGSGYDDISSVDYTNANIYGGVIRNSVFGGGEISIVGRGTWNEENSKPNITKAGLATVNMFNGHVKQNVFGGGKGFNSLGYGGGHNTHTDGMVFGQTRVNIHGGEIGTEEGVTNATESGTVGNVFGGGDAGVVYSAYELSNGTLAYGKSSGKRYNKGLTSTSEGYGDEGYYYKYENNAFKTVNGEKVLTEDCKVVVEPWLQVTEADGISYDGKTYAKDDYIPTAYLNTLPNKTSTGWGGGWANVDAGTPPSGNTPEQQRGIIIHNAVFAGGNITVGGSMNANTTTVFGNATASIHDVYNRDFVTIGTGNVGGLYGDGNLTLVDGYRELNITNYGTDYYHIFDPNHKTISITEYNKLPAREKEYYEVKYVCKQACKDNENTNYTAGSTLTRDEVLVRFAGRPNVIVNGEPSDDYWEKSGEVTMYAGRLLSTIQRADFCGVWGSRMIMKGAKDRVPEELDFNDYTINRVREVSLNEKTSTGSPDHGNYFGIFNNVNYLGALTSDVDFWTTKRAIDNNDEAFQPDYDPANSTISLTGTEKEQEATLDYLEDNPIPGVTVDGTSITASTIEALYKVSTVPGVSVSGTRLTNQTYSDWKAIHSKENTRNNGTSHNQVALASGVCLQLTSEEKPGKGYAQLYDTEWGLITGVVQLDLINVATGIGGGYVYAKNVHGVRGDTGKKQTTLTSLNENAATYKKWEYIETGGSNSTQEEFQTSGNFVHNSKTILDDCHDQVGHYTWNGNRVPAHKWYIKGQIYIYDQYISAYTGSPNAYSEAVGIPLTITADSHGQMKLIDVQPNLYAYYSSYTDEDTNIPLTADSKLVINDVTYNLNDPITYWDWSQLPEAEQHLFEHETYIVFEDCKIGSKTYKAGDVLSKRNYDALITDPNNPTYPTVKKIVNGVEVDEAVNFTDIVHSSNNISHDTGYILTYKMNNPRVWDQWYTQESSTAHAKRQTAGDGYTPGPTYYLNPDKVEGEKNGIVLGQHEYSVSDIVPDSVYTNYATLKANHQADITATGKEQGTFERAYITTAYVEVDNLSGTKQHLQEGAKIAKSQYTNTDTWPTALSGKVAEALVCTKTIQLSETEIIYSGTLMTASDKSTYKTKYADKATDIEKFVVDAYYCTTSGYYGGNYYQKNCNYYGQETWSAMSENDRDYFVFNYDALDLLIDPTYSQAEGKKYQYDSAAGTLEGAQGNPAGYSLTQSVDYSATYTGTAELPYTSVDENDQPVTKTAINGTILSRTEYESLLNEQRYYVPVTVSTAGTYYIVNTSFYYNEPYAAGQVISKGTFNSLPDSETTSNEQQYITQVTFNSDQSGKTYYYCREQYTIDSTNGHPVKSIAGSNSNAYEKGATVPVGAIIGLENTNVGTGESAKTYYGFINLTNKQQNFEIHGTTPLETSTFFVARGSDIDDLSKEKIITVVYQYEYDESDQYNNITPINERHVLNIHIRFRSGEPVLGEILPPDIVLPGTSVTPKVPTLLSGAYEIIGGGWELYEDSIYAKNHTNGVEYTPSSEPLYWYQDGYYLAYYAKTTFGKTYSNYVPVAVANYHDMKEVMEDLKQHLHVDHNKVKRDCKIYINDYSSDTEGSKNGLDVFKSFFDLSILNSPETDDKGLIKSGTFQGHKPLDEHVKAGDNLQFILHTDIDHTGSTWTPIGKTDNDTNPENDVCFEGTLHGDGHLLSGLAPATGTTGSLFSKLCGQVYNLGVTGSFTGGGVADYADDGYAENCWVMTSGTPAANTKAIIGITASNQGTQIENCYSLIDNNYDLTTSVGRGVARPMPAKAFYNGEVAYNLNGFYLHKRFYDNNTSWTGTKVTYNYWKPVNGTLTMSPGEYPDTYAYYPLDNNIQRKRGYVEQRFKDGDFRYVGENGGIIPTDPEIRMKIVEETDPDTGEKYDSTYFVPIWPDDYLFFGQRLNYGHVAGITHQDLPTAIARDESLLDMSTWGNRVYRAPAYFRSNEMSTAYFNPNAVFAQSKKGDANVLAYKNMTAIDFSGGNGDLAGGYKEGLNDTKFFAPLLDDDGITGFHNIDLTKNLLAYTMASGTTANTVSAALPEPKYTETEPTKYHTVAPEDPAPVLGHWVAQDGTGYTASVDHFLVDKQDFNAPISYTFLPYVSESNPGTRMWYQREPERYVGTTGEGDSRTTKGWEGISLPFTADLVTTNDKGEITHFYSGSDYSFNSTGTKIGHEYWLREYTGIKDEGVETLANFDYPTSASTDADKEYKNTFLWDYYYQGSHSHKDVNDDTYQTYYKTAHTHKKYARLDNGTPYIIGFPGKMFYEFDLSGEFVASTTGLTHPFPLDKQTITFASAPGATIGISDDEMVGVTKDGYTFKTSYMNEELAVGTNKWALDKNGDSYDQVIEQNGGPIDINDGSTHVDAFRPYFTVAASSPTREYRNNTRSIVFNRNTAEMYEPEDDDISNSGEIAIYARGRNIYTVSALEESIDIRIINASGAVLTTYTLEPGKTIVTPVTAPGTYLVNKKKLYIK